MNRKPLLFLLVIACCQSLLIAQYNGSDQHIVDAIAEQGQAFVKDKKINSVSIGIYKSGERYIQHFGELEKGKGNPPTNETIYEIASVTKTMTGYLVAKAVLEKKLGLKDPVAIYLDGDYSNLSFNTEPVTIKHLLTHTGGMPMFLPKSMNGLFETKAADVPQRYLELEKSYDKTQFLTDLKSVTLTEAPGKTYFYSNAGTELIGHILETVYKKSIDQLFEESFLKKRGMNSTGIVLNAEQQARLIKGYWMNNTQPSPNQLNTLWATGSGAKTNMPDMLSYIEFQLDTEDPIIVESHRALFEVKSPLNIGYLWRIWTDKYGTSYRHHGGTGGMQNWLFIFPKYDLGISIMTNQSDYKTPDKLRSTVRKILKSIIKT